MQSHGIIEHKRQKHIPKTTELVRHTIPCTGTMAVSNLPITV